MSEEETKVETVAEETAVDETAAAEPAKKKGKKKWPIVVGVVVVVFIAAGAGLLVWHYQTRIFNAISHL